MDNHQKKKTWRIILIAISVYLLIIFLIWILISSLVPPNKERMDVYLKRDIKDLKIVADFFVNSDYSYIYIDKINFKDKVMFTGIYTHYQKIDDKAILKVLWRLFYLKGYKAIGFNDNTVYFLKWSFGENDRGIAISVDGEIEPTVDYLIELIPLSKTGWYYYEADYYKFYNK